jgi:hypothetical protein
MKELVADVYESRYGKSLSFLGSHRGALALDLNLSDHVAYLVSAIRDRLILL